MMERNPCTAIGCPAACCRNISGQVAGRSRFFLEAFPNAQPVRSEEELTDKLKKQEHGVYYVESRGWTYFAISGNCPNLMPNFSCGIHEEKYYPKPCINMEFNSGPCIRSKNIYNGLLHPQKSEDLMD
ncbi:MAG: hypothetical protein HYV90_03975 [Candidatus Woesebacteria bacterium]|nr:MAG: hypothetical protein HYV90_03975 [Candidatus Woesebacteria bacterium]